MTCLRRAGSGDGLKGRLWGFFAGAGSGEEFNGRLWGLWPRAFPTLKALCSHLHSAYRKLFEARENVPAGKPGSTPPEMWREQLVCANPAKAPASRPGRLTCPYVPLQGGLRPRLRDEGRASDGLEEHAPGGTQPGSAARPRVSPVRWRLPLVSGQLQAGTWALRSEGAELGPVPPGTCHGWAVPLVPRSRCAHGRTQPRVPRRRPPVGTTHQSPSHAYGLGADCGPQPPGTLAHAGAWTTEEEAHRGFQL